MPFTNQELPGRQCAARAHNHFDIRLVAVGCHAAIFLRLAGRANYAAKYGLYQALIGLVFPVLRF